jgi:hypothetical protein
LEKGFMEWFADETAKWVVQGRKVGNAKQSFFKRIVQALETLLQTLGLTATPGASPTPPRPSCGRWA